MNCNRSRLASVDVTVLLRTVNIGGEIAGTIIRTQESYSQLCMYVRGKERVKDTLGYLQVTTARLPFSSHLR